uniref:Alpha-glucosidase n=1 Tax=Euplotes crassus TaxID=5936 RepID=A0A7S3P2K7_EUPCR
MSYFPSNSRFIDLISLEVIEVKGNGKQVSLEARWDYPLIHMREGTIIPYQKFGQSMTTNELVSENYIQLLIFSDRHQNAEGTLYVDKDGISLKEISSNTFEYYKITFSENMIRIALADGFETSGKLDKNQIVENITVVDAAMYNDTDFACMFDENMDSTPIVVDYDEEKETLHFLPRHEKEVIELRSIRGIQFGNSREDESFCNPTYVISDIQVDKEGDYANKKVTVKVEATNGDMSSFDAEFYLLKDNLINVDFVPDISPEPFEMPNIVLNSTLYPNRKSFATGDIMSYLNLPKVGESFYFEIHAKDNKKDLIFSSKGQPIVYTKYYKSMGAHVYGTKMFGIGQRIGEFWKNPGTYAVWNRGAEHVEEDGINPGKNLYGSHPVYFVRRKKGGNDWVGVYEHNSGPQEFVIARDGNGMDITNIKTTGRTNMFFMLNEEIDKVISNYYELVGKPVLPPRWAFGWHQSRFGYNTTDALKEVYNGYREHELPLDGIWSSVDVLDDFRSFTVDEENFEGIKDFINEIKEKGTRYVPIIQSGISAGNNDAYNDGLKRNVFMMSPGGDYKPIIGRSTAGDVVYVDFTYHGSPSYWHDQMEKLNEKLPFDGVWLDMNEITSECDGYCYASQRAEDPIDNKLFYWPGGRDLEVGTVSIDVQHELGSIELDSHSLYGFWQTYMSHVYFGSLNKRPMVISRSTFAGSGKFGGHWLGENRSWYQNMKQSVDNILLFNMFGIPFVGDNVCGFKGNAGIETCTRWYKVAVIYPFSRNHNDFGTDPQEPYIERFNEIVDKTLNITATEIIRKAMMTKYGLHNYMYTQYHKASKDGKVPLKPLFFNYPNEPYSYDYVSSSILVGDAVLASLDTTSGVRQYYYFPGRGEIWCPIWDIAKYECIRGGSRTLSKIPIQDIWLHIRAGHVIPLQLSDANKFDLYTGLRSLDDLQNLYTDIGFLLDSDNEAHGEMRFDDGETVDLDHYDEIKVHAKGEIPWVGRNKIDIEFELTHAEATVMTNSQKLGEVLLYNAKKLGFVKSGDGDLVDIDNKQYPVTFTYDDKMDLARIKYEAEEAIPIKNVQRIHIQQPR